MEVAQTSGSARLAAALFLLLTSAAAGVAQQVRPGVWAGRDLGTLPLPSSGYGVYLLGEMHGSKEIDVILGQYVAILHKSAGLRDVAIEEDAVYERDAQAYVEGRSDTIPEQLCLRAGILEAVRRFNAGRRADGPIRVHLVDIDTPAAAIRQHLMILREQVAGGSAVRVPRVSAIKAHGLKTVDDLKRLTRNEQLLRELRTVQYSIRAYRQGLEAGTTWQFKGSPYLDDREQAIASNIQDLLHDPDCQGLLAVYGTDHVSKTRRRDGGPRRDRDFAPMALRLQQAGVRVFSLMTFPLSGRVYWRGRGAEVLWTAADASLASGEKLDRVLAAAGQPSFVFIEPKWERIRLPSQDANAFAVDAYLLIATATPMENHCASR